jgi:2-dehydropantoate 2-reductase
MEGTRFSIGEPDGSKSDRCRRIADAFINAGLRCPIRTNIRHDIWVKLMGNVAYNPISALTRATLIEIVQCPETRALAAAIMTEVDAVARKLGIDIGVSVEQRLEGAEKVGQHKTSMLQDIETGKPTELEAIVGAIIELGDKLGVQLPNTKSVYACVKLLESARKT